MKQEKRRPQALPHGDISPMPRGYRIEISQEGQSARILISGVERILCAEEECVTVRAGRKTLTLCGQSLACLALEGGILEIKGILSSLSVSRGGMHEKAV